MVRRTFAMEEWLDNAVSIMARLDNCSYSEEVRRIIIDAYLAREKELEEDE